MTVRRWRFSFRRRGLQRLNLETGDVSAFVVDGRELANVDPVLDRLTREVVGFSYADSLPRQIFLDADLAGLLAELEQILTEDSVVISAWSQNREKFVVVGRDAGKPANYYLLDLTLAGWGSWMWKWPCLKAPATHPGVRLFTRRRTVWRSRPG